MSGLEPKTSIFEKQTTWATATNAQSATSLAMIPGVRITWSHLRSGWSAP